MLDQLTEEKWPQTLKRIIIWCTAIMLVISLFFPASYFYNNMIKEIGWGKTMIGSTDFPYVMRNVNQFYNSFFIDTGIDGGLKEFYQLKPSDIAQQGGPLVMFVGFFRNMAEVLNYWFFMIMYRATLLMYWLPYMMIVIVPSIFAGTMQWMAKRYTFGYSSPYFNRRSLTMIGWGIYSVMLSLFVPLPMPPMVGALMMIVLIPVGSILLISNLPKRI